MKKFLLGLAAGLIAVSALALATPGPSYFGWNPSTGLETIHGALVDGGATAVVLKANAASNSCFSDVTASSLASASGQFTSTIDGACLIDVVFPAASNGPSGHWYCGVNDVTDGTAGTQLVTDDSATVAELKVTTASASAVVRFACRGI